MRKRRGQLSIRQMILQLEKMDGEKTVIIDNGEYSPYLLYIASWRWDFSHLAIGFIESDYEYAKIVSVKSLLEELRSTIGQTFEGWKGGDYTMSKNTPVWIANIGLEGFDGNNKEKSYVVDVVNFDGKISIVTKVFNY